MYIVTVSSNCGIEEMWAFDTEEQAIECDTYIRSLEEYMSPFFNISYSVLPINADYRVGRFS